MRQLSRIENNDTLSALGIERSIDKLLRKQPREILNQMDIPCAYTRLPYTTQWQIREVFFNKDLSHDTKARAITDILNKIPPEQRYIPASHICRDNKGTKSKYFDSYSAITYKISFTFKLSELRAHLPFDDFEAIDDALRNETFSTE
uniref:Uncharacterized protein n=1 Tax=Acrobeloides nanus TaxID=290746 RepID=A0A914D9Y6_9BILA